ncbi:MAG: hypothetical protein OXB84_05845 [Halobacteriovoraceae bacterium]|nr:hypothetical protein [Halobacteriovoraceae bacterium]
MSTLKVKDDSLDPIKRTANKMAIKAYNNRLVSLKLARGFYANGDFSKGAQLYEKYLTILANYFEINKENLAPSCFNPKKDLSEMFLISHAYWDLALTYDRHADTVDKCVHALERFIVFSTNFKYHSINFRMMRNYLRSKKVYNKKNFDDAFDQMKVNVKACYIANYCLGEEHPAVEVLRDFRTKLVFNRLGSYLVEYYYLISPKIIVWVERSCFLRGFFKLCIRPLLLIFAKVLRKII